MKSWKELVRSIQIFHWESNFFFVTCILFLVTGYAMCKLFNVQSVYLVQVLDNKTSLAGIFESFFLNYSDCHVLYGDRV